jgi:chromosome segregation ATPase
VSKNRALATIDNQIKSAQAYTADLMRRQEELKKRKASLGSKPVPPDIDRDLNTIDVELARQSGLIKQKTEDIATVTARYDADKKRWQDIKADQQRSAVASGAADATSAPKAPAPAPPAKK